MSQTYRRDDLSRLERERKSLMAKVKKAQKRIEEALEKTKIKQRKKDADKQTGGQETDPPFIP